MPEILKISAACSEKDVLSQAAALVAAGGVIAYPTDTFYGLGADAANEQAIQKIFAIKGRNFANPISVIIGSRQEIHSLVRNIPANALILIEYFWPGPLTLVFEAASSVLPSLTANSGKIGIRLPGYESARKIAILAGRPLTATSANLSGEPECRSATEALKQLGDKLDAVVDLPAPPGVQGSTIIDVTGNQPRLLRQGVITGQDIKQKTGLKIIL